MHQARCRGLVRQTGACLRPEKTRLLEFGLRGARVSRPPASMRLLSRSGKACSSEVRNRGSIPAKSAKLAKVVHRGWLRRGAAGGLVLPSTWFVHRHHQTPTICALDCASESSASAGTRSDWCSSARASPSEFRGVADRIRRSLAAGRSRRIDQNSLDSADFNACSPWDEVDSAKLVLHTFSLRSTWFSLRPRFPVTGAKVVAAVRL
jgi:hypothetical protein